MAGVAPYINYAARTFEVIRQIGLDLLKTRVGSYRYKSFVATDTIPAIIDVVSYFHEQAAFYYDRRRINGLLFMADTRESMSVLTLAQGYRMRPATSASVAVIASPQPAQPVPITLKQGTRITAAGLTFEVAHDAVIPAGAVSWPDGTTHDLIVLVEGSTVTDTFISDGSPFQSFDLSQPGAIDQSVAVAILGETWGDVPSLAFVEGDQRGRDTFTSEGGDSQQYDLRLLNAIIGLEDEDALVVLVQPFGMPRDQAVKWKQVAVFSGAPHEFVVSQATDGTSTIQFGLAANGAAPNAGDTIDALYLILGSQKRYQLVYDPDNRGTLGFGDGVFGVIPPAGAAITATYRVGGGPAGNVASGVINTAIQGSLPAGQNVAVLIQNIEAGSGGEPPETVEHARYFAPRYALSNERAVTREDFTTLASTYIDPVYGAPSHASAFLKQAIPELNTVQVAVWGRDAVGNLATAGSPLKFGIQNFLNSKRTICTSVEMLDGKVVLMDVSVSVVLMQGKIRQAVFSALTTNITQFFQGADVRPGRPLSISRLYNVIQNTDGVDTAEITSVLGSLKLTMVLGVGDGATALFSGQYALPEGTAIVGKSLTATDGTQQVIDNGTGGFVGSIDPTVVQGATGNAVDYSTGSFSIQFAAPPQAGVFITSSVKVQAFFNHVENLGASDGTVQLLDGATDYYPIVKRSPRGVWAGDQRTVIDAFKIGTTAHFRGTLPRGITPGTLVITDSSGGPQVVIDNGVGVLTQAGPAVGSVSYVNGTIDFTFSAPPTLPVFARWTTVMLDITVPADYLPLTPGRVFLWGGYDADGSQVGGALLAADDGEGNIFGDMIVGGTIDYGTGRILAKWNATPPGAGGATVIATLTQVPDGVRKVFDFTTGMNLSRTGVQGEGRLHFWLSGLSRVGVTFQDAWDNHGALARGAVNGQSLNRIGENYVVYGAGLGKLTFLVPPPVGAPATFTIQVSNVTTMLYAGWVFRVKTPGGPGLDKGLFADQQGRFWGPPAAGSSNPFPIDQLDALRGRYHAALAGSAVAAGRSMFLSYDALTSVPPALDIPLEGDEVAAIGRIALTEKPSEVFANA